MPQPQIPVDSANTVDIGNPVVPAAAKGAAAKKPTTWYTLRYRRHWRLKRLRRLLLQYLSRWAPRSPDERKEHTPNWQRRCLLGAVQQRGPHVGKCVGIGEIVDKLHQHERWLAHDGRVGRQLDLTNVDLRGRNDLIGKDLRRAKLTGACLWDIDLTGADLTDAEGVLPGSLSGAVLTRTKLPSQFSTAETLKAIEELSKNAGRLFLSLMLAGIFVLLTLAKVQEIPLITATGTAGLPVINVEVPVRLFFLIAPIVLVTLFFSVHLYLQRLWELMATLPAVFPDGVRLDRKTYPWLLNDKVTTHFPHLRKLRTTMGMTQRVLFGALAYWFVSLVLVPIWARYLCRHDWFVTGVHVVAITVAITAALQFWYLARVTLRRDVWRHQICGNWSSRRNKAMIAAQACLFLSLAGAVAMMSDGAINGVSGLNRDAGAHNSISNREEKFLPNINDRAQVSKLNYSGVETGLRKWVPAILRTVGWSDVAELKEASVSTKPAQWQDQKVAYLEETIKALAQIENRYLPEREVRQFLEQTRETAGKSLADFRSKYPADMGARLPDGDLRRAYLERAFLMSADLRGIHMESAVAPEADFSFSKLAYGNLSGAFLKGTNFAGADLKNADLSEVDLEDAFLICADLQRGDLRHAYLSKIHFELADLHETNLLGANLIEASLIGANLSRANLSRADLSQANLLGAWLSQANLLEANLSKANLIEADLSGANLLGANLSEADLSEADLIEADLIEANLRQADLVEANLSRANLRQADLVEANLGGAHLSKANLIEADLSRANLSGANLSGADLSGANLSGAYLSGANLSGANLSRADLTRAFGLTQE